MTEPAAAGQPVPRAFLRVGGSTLARHQLGLALAMDCQRVICIARGTSPELIALQHAAEDAGLQFYISTGARPLSGLVTASDELVVVSEGLFADPARAAALFDGVAPAVLVQPVEGALAEGFERIDLNRAGAGLLQVPGRLVEQLHELPADCDVPSALMRIALQSGVPMREIPADARGGANWRMVRNEAEAHAVETEWLRERFGAGERMSPGQAVARKGVVAFGSTLLHAGNASNVLSAAVLVALAIAGGLAWFGALSTAFLFGALGAILVEASRLIRSAERQALGQLPPAIPRANVLGWLIDATIGLLILASVTRLFGESLLSWMFPPAMLMMLLALVPRVVAGPVTRFANDRALLCVVLALAAGFGQVEPLVEVLAVVLVVLGMALPLRRKG
ncbi:hypothetical protein WBP07_06700 [Novosphingobium sp. BL-8A]|uniref:hypothetical protein n=1 Tax=Novosphingobium sp. BL-8A TaxID=3127639 RepID=UPI0037566687